MLDYKNANYEELNWIFNEVNWMDVLCSDDLDNSVSKFYEIVNNGVVSNVSKCKCKCVNVTSTYPVWYSSELKVLIEDKKILHRDWKQNHDPLVREEFEKLRTKCIKISKSCFFKFFIRLNLKLNSNAFWKYIGQLKGSKNLSSTMFLSNKSGSDGSGISNLIASHIKSVYKNSPTSPPPPDFYLFEEDNILLSNLVITVTEVSQ